MLAALWQGLIPAVALVACLLAALNYGCLVAQVHFDLSAGQRAVLRVIPESGMTRSEYGSERSCRSFSIDLRYAQLGRSMKANLGRYPCVTCAIWAGTEEKNDTSLLQHPVTGFVRRPDSLPLDNTGALKGNLCRLARSQNTTCGAEVSGTRHWRISVYGHVHT